MGSLVDSVMANLDANRINAIAQQLGTDPTQARAAIEHALPVLVGTMARNASAPGGADILHSALSNDHAGVDVGGLLSNMLSGGGSSAGSAILSHIFGANQTAANQGLGQVTGLGQQNAGQLMAMLAPLVMGVLGNMTQQQGLSPGGLGGLLGREAQQIAQQGGVAQGLLGALLNHSGGNLDVSHLIAGAGGLLGMFGRR